MSFIYHYNLIYNDLKDSVENFSWGSGHTKLALKTSLSCVTAIFLANLFKLNMPFWSGITTLVIMRANIGASFSKGWMRTGGCTLGCILCLFFLGYTIQNPLYFTMFLFIGIFLGFYFGVRAKHGYFWFYMLANMALIGMVSISNPYDNFPLDIVFYRSAEIFLGVIVSWFYNIIIWPNYSGNKFEETLNNLVYKIADFHAYLINIYIGKDKPDELNIRFNKLTASIINCKSLITDINSENFLLRNEKVDYNSILSMLENRLLNLDNGIIENFQRMKRVKLPVLSFEFLSSIALKLMRLTGIENFRQNKFYLALPGENDFYTMLNKISAARELKKINVSDSLFFYEFVHHIEAMCNDLKKISTANYLKVDSIGAKQDRTDFIYFNLFSLEASLYIPSLKNALKGALCVIVIFWICLWLQIPGGYANMSVAIIAVLGPQLNTLASKHKGLLRFLGCLIGAALGLSFLLLNTDSAYTYFIVIFCVTSFTSYIFGAKQGVAYIGLQSGIAFLVCVADGFGPVTSIAPVIERLAGIFLAVLLMWLINYVLWPENLYLDLLKKLKFINESVIEQLTDLRNSLKEFSLNTDAGVVCVDDLSSILDFLKVTEDLKFGVANDINLYVMNIQKISKKLDSLGCSSKEMLMFIESESKDLVAGAFNNISLVIERRGESIPNELKEMLNSSLKKIDLFLGSMRSKEIMKSKNICFKQETAWFILMLKRVLYDTKILSEISIDYNIINEGEYFNGKKK